MSPHQLQGMCFEKESRLLLLTQGAFVLSLLLISTPSDLNSHQKYFSCILQ